MSQFTNLTKVMEYGDLLKNKVKKTFLLFAAFFFCAVNMAAQDVITLKNGEDIQSLVQEIGEVDIKYKKFDNPNGPNYTLKKSEIFMIRYANGSKDVFVNNASPVSVTIPTTEQSNIQNNNGEVLIQNNTTDQGVVINGVKWATRNVDKPGTFAAKSEDVGMFYQWNRKIAWIATGSVTDWDSSIPSGTDWYTVSDPSPTGWHVPTFDEIKTLLDSKKVFHTWTIENGICGRKFTDKSTGNSIFLPAAGYRRPIGGVHNGKGSEGRYWSRRGGANIFGTVAAYFLNFDDKKASRSGNSLLYGFNIRPVSD